MAKYRLISWFLLVFSCIIGYFCNNVVCGICTKQSYLSNQNMAEDLSIRKDGKACTEPHKILGHLFKDNLMESVQLKKCRNGQFQSGKILKCKICSKEFYRMPSLVKSAKYCSNECRFKGQDKRTIKKVCPHCKKVFYVSPAFGSRKYCSYKCKGIAKRTTIKQICDHCGKSFYGIPSQAISVRGYKKRYCSWECYTNRTGFENNPNWRGGKFVKCNHCGKKIWRMPSDIKKNGNYCSRKCLNEYQIGENTSNWRGGLSREPYPLRFDEKLKEKIRKRDNYTCQLCGCLQEDYFQKLSVHHIDYDKRNLDERNLISLCCGCNTKVNNNRKNWVRVFAKCLATVC